MGKGKLNVCFLDNALFGCGRRICGCICCFLFIGPIFIITGVVLFDLAKLNPRDGLIADYNEAVDVWTNGAYASFAAKGLNYGVLDSSSNVVLMENVTTKDTISDSGANIHTYSSYLKYKLSGAFLRSTTSSSTSFSLKSFSNGITYSIPIQAYTTHTKTPHTLSCTHACSSSGHSSSEECYDDNTCDSACASVNGEWDTDLATCYFINFISDVCVEVKTDGTINTYNPLCYGQSYGRDLPDTNHNGYRTIPSFTVTVRSAQDPFITLYSLTGGSLWFGFTASQYNKMGVGFIVAGALVIVAVVAGLALICKMGYCLCFGSKDKHHHHHHHHHENVQYSLLSGSV